MNFRRGYLALVAVPVLAIGLAACGGSNNSDNGSSNAASTLPVATSSSSNSDAVSTKSVSGVGTVLVDSKGDVLYTNNQDTASKMACTSACQAIWPPLMASSGAKPTSSDSAVQAKLAVANGQVTYNGMPVYTFVQDSPGQATGNGVTDSFGGTSFTWTAVMTGGSAASSGSSAAAPASSGSSGAAAPSTMPSSGSSSSGGSSSGGGYGY
jgi:predicted lipoprotein with Yx(FWY)xxD motif